MKEPTPKQKEILQKLVEGKTAKEVARDLGVSYQTVKQHTRKLRDRIGVVSIYRAVAMAVVFGWVKLPGKDSAAGPDQKASRHAQAPKC